MGDRFLGRPEAGDSQSAQELAEGAAGNPQLQRAISLAARLALEAGDLRQQSMVAREDNLFVFRRAVNRDSGVVTGVDASVADDPAQVMSEFRIPLGRQIERLPAVLEGGHQ